jgi:hypothetical protein
VWTQIRLADRQGLLSGRGLSTVQVTAVYICELFDQRQDILTRADEFKYALLGAAGHIPVEALFPELFTETDDSADLPSDEDKVTYRFEDHSMSEEEMERELAQLMAGGEMTVSGDEMSHGA